MAALKPTPFQLAQVQRELIATSHEVAGMSEDAVHRMLPVLAQAERETTNSLREWLKRANGSERYTTQQRRNTLLHLRTAFAQIERLYPALYASLVASGHVSAAMAVKHLTNEVARLSEVFEGSAIRIPLNVARIIGATDKQLLRRYLSSARRYSGNVRRDIERELAVGVVRGETVFELTNRLQRLGGPRGRVVLNAGTGAAENISEGLFTRYRYWASRIARTESINAYNVQVNEGLHEAREYVPDIKRRWDSAADSRVCPWCADLGGEVRGIDEQFEDGLDGAPAHPCCRCRVGAWRDGWSEVLRSSGYDTGRAGSIVTYDRADE